MSTTLPNGTTDRVPQLRSCLCTQQQLESPVFQDWADRMGEPRGRLLRKIWEWCYIAEALSERHMLRQGRSGLGFAVGEEPLPALFASLGCTITATDLETARAAGAGWVQSGQHAHDLDLVNKRGLCDPDDFRNRVTFRFVDMNRIPGELKAGYDFLWSSCALEHLGSLTRGERFVYNAMACLKPGGVAVHTTEFNVHSNDLTEDYKPIVIFRRRDMERIAARLTACGHTVEPFSFDAGHLPVDEMVDEPPYRDDRHLKLLIGSYVCTSVGFIITKTGTGIPKAPRWVTRPTPRDRFRLFRSSINRWRL